MRMVRKLRAHPFWRRLQDRPFATAMALLFVLSPLAQLLGATVTPDVLERLVPHSLWVALQLAYFGSGLLILCGLGTNRVNVEAAGCVMAVSGLAVRLVAMLFAIGATPGVIAAGLFYAVFGGACIERTIQCLKGDHIVRVHTVVDMEVPDDDQ